MRRGALPLARVHIASLDRHASCFILITPRHSQFMVLIFIRRRGSDRYDVMIVLLRIR